MAPPNGRDHIAVSALGVNVNLTLRDGIIILLLAATLAGALIMQERRVQSSLEILTKGHDTIVHLLERERAICDR